MEQSRADRLSFELVGALPLHSQYATSMMIWCSGCHVEHDIAGADVFWIFHGLSFLAMNIEGILQTSLRKKIKIVIQTFPLST
jgi:hypothetical protein